MVKRLVAEAGAVKAGVVTLGPVDDGAERLYLDWIADGKHGDMSYLEKYADVRHDPRRLLDGAKSMIVAAFSYYWGEGSNRSINTEMPVRSDSQWGGYESGKGAEIDTPLVWARYALGRDYHEEVRERLGKVAEAITSATGAQCRVTVDTAPLRERYWAVKAGVGFIGINNQLIVPGAGSWCVLGEIITTLELEPDEPCRDSCLGCMRCVRACPGHALDGRRGMDARRCMSYLSIEKRYSEADADTTPYFGNRIYGCDICQEVCPHNAGARMSEIEGFRPRQSILSLTRGDILCMEQGDFSRIFSHSAIKRAKLAGLQRNARSQGGREATQPE